MMMRRTLRTPRELAKVVRVVSEIMMGDFFNRSESSMWGIFLESSSALQSTPS